MKRGLLLLMLIAASPAFSQSQPAARNALSPAIQKRVENFLRKLYAWGPSFELKVSESTAPPVAGFYPTSVEVTYQGQSERAVVYVSADGRFLMRGELNDMLADPFAAAKPHLQADDSPSKGPADARVTVVDFSDFQCPHCRDLHKTLKEIEPLYPQVRFIFREFPLEQIHPWAMTAAIAARCAYLQSPPAFWKVQDAIFENQENIKPDSAWDKMVELGTQAGLQPDGFRACMASTAAKAAIENDLAEGRALGISSTPTVFVNGRALIGGDKRLLEQYISYELSVTAQTPHPK